MTGTAIHERPKDEGRAGSSLLSFDREACLRLDRSLSREWLETNGQGAYASSTALLVPTRRYHGLLVAPPEGHAKRHVFLARLEESIHRPEKSFPLSTARYGGTWHPTGYSAIESFDLAPYPSWRYRIGQEEIVREILLLPGEPTVLVRYRLDGERDDIELRLRPLLAFRDADDLTFENLHLNPKVERTASGVRSRPYAELPALTLAVDGESQGFEADPVWYRGVEYGADLERGYGGHEDHFSPGWFSVPLRPGSDLVFSATLNDGVEAPARRWAEEADRRRRVLPDATRSVRGRLEVAADAYVVTEGAGKRTGVIAGYPWFGEWGRDTCIALPGLLLARGQVEATGDALESMVPFLRRGLIPNVFGYAAEDSSYGSADASLWFARAVRLYERAGGDGERVREVLRPALESIATHYRDGTGLGIHCDDQGGLHAGTPEVNATWMDAVVGDGPVTPRHGCAVELNALWYALLTHLEKLAGQAGDEPAVRTWTKLRRRVRRTFLERFWIPGDDYLADVWREDEVDRAVRPNMVIAAALEASPLTRGQRTDVVRRARAELLTPYGLRTLSPEDPRYVGHYAGGPEERDEAYHQGTVWPWLTGFFAEAWLRAFGFKKKRVAFLRDLLDGFGAELREAGLNQVSEIHDGDPPHRPGGTPAQAWSVAELLRANRMLEEGRL